MRAKTESELKLSGTWRPDRHSKRPRPAGGGDLPMPAGLSKDREAAAMFRRLRQQLGSALEPSDVPALLTLCLTYSLMIRSAAELAEGGVAIPDPVHGPDSSKRNPSVLVFLQSSDRFLRLCREFGLTPATKRHVLPERDDSAENLEDLLNWAVGVDD